MMLNRRLVPAMIAVALSTTGCLQKETAHDLYVSPDGAVSWVASETNVYSDESDVGKRMDEEQGYVGPVLLGAHGIARALSALGPQRPVKTTIVRDERPFHVITEARFDRIDQVLDRLFTKSGIRTAATLDRDGEQTTLRVRLDFSRELRGGDTTVFEPLLDIDRFRFVLAEGTFGEVIGFDVPDKRSAIFSKEWLDRAGQAFDEKRPIDFSLSWTTR